MKHFCSILLLSIIFLSCQKELSNENFGPTNPSALIPTITTTAVTSITNTTAATGGNITSDGGATVIARGVCWSTTTNPTIAGNHTTDGTGTGTFASAITSLIPNTLYYVRAYATNSAGTAYGNDISFTTTTTSTALPTVTTAAIGSITALTSFLWRYGISRWWGPRNCTWYLLGHNRKPGCNRQPHNRWSRIRRICGLHDRAYRRYNVSCTCLCYKQRGYSVWG